jgi:hypothetical protein
MSPSQQYVGEQYFPNIRIIVLLPSHAHNKKNPLILKEEYVCLLCHCIDL